MATHSSAAAASPSNLRIAVVCHHDARAREATSGFVAQLGLQAISLPEPPNTTDSAFFDRLERLSDPHFAIVVLAANTKGTASAVPNALSPELQLELGFLIGKLGRARICFLVAGNVAMAPPWEGVVRLSMDEAGTWRLLLARALKQAGLDVDMNRAL